MKKIIILLFALGIFGLLLFTALASSQLQSSNGFNLKKCVSSCLKTAKNQTKSCDSNLTIDSKECRIDYKNCLVWAKNSTNRTQIRVNNKNCQSNYTICKSIATSKDKDCKNNITQSCNDTCNLMSCHNYYWYDNFNKDCSNKSFCGLFMYEGLHTFENQSECIKETNVTVTKCDDLLTNITSNLKKVESCKNDSDCKIENLNDAPCNILLCGYTSINKTSNLSLLNSMFKDYKNNDCIKICPMTATPLIACMNPVNATSKCDNGTCRIVYPNFG